MTTVNVNFGINIDVNSILKACGMGAQTYEDNDVWGGRFVTSMGNGQMMAAFIHPSRRHTATCYHGDTIASQSVKDGGKWAIAMAPKALFGNRMDFNILAKN